MSLPTFRFQSFSSFYPYYLHEHRHPVNRRLHVIGTGIGLAMAASLLVQGKAMYLPLAVIPAYSLAWFGHLFIERNRPATFQYPLYSLMGDLRLFYETLSGQRRF